MVYGCAGNTVKCLVFTFNFLAFVAGLGILIGSAVIYAAPGVSDQVLREVEKDVGSLQSLKAAMIVGMVIGGFICLLGFLGCCGALCESGAMLCLFGTVMVAMLIVQVAIGITAFVSKGKLQDQLDRMLLQNAEVAFNKSAGASGHLENSAECDFYLLMANSSICCGYNATFNFTGPEGICYNQEGCTQDNVWQRPCKDELWNLLERGAKIIGILALVFILLELAATIFGCCLWTAIRKGERLYDYA